LPVSDKQPDCRELKYVLEDAGVSVVLSSPDYADRMVDLAKGVGAQHFSLGEEVRQSPYGNTSNLLTFTTISKSGGGGC